MMRIYTFTLATLIASSVGAQTAVRPETFAYRTTINASGSDPFHQIALPLTLYQGVQRSDLGDVRVFNAQGEVVPHALLRHETRTVSQVNETTVPLFPIVTPASKPIHAGDISIEVRKNADGTLVSVRQTPSTTNSGNVVRGVVLDASKIKNGVRFLRLSAGPSNSPFHRYSIETSDDLQQWRLLKGDAQLVRMEHDGQRIERSHAEWDSDAGKYLRILWADPQQAPAITAVSLGVMQTSVDQAPRIWSEPIAASSVQPSTYDYVLPGRMPLEQLRINLPQVNTLAPLQIQRFVATEIGHRRHREYSGWETMARSVVYRLQSPQGEVNSPEIDLHAPPESRLRLAIDTRSGGIGASPPSVQVGFVPHTLVFLARGNPPFTLAWGAPAIANAALDIATLVPGYRADQKLAASSAKLQLTAPTSPSGKTPAMQTGADQPLSKNVLWAVLIAGVLILGGMAAMLLRQMKRPEKK
ncbi:MAG: DUF3999 domain-containing protein [Burkholderiales bacterium]|nr:DUF3999 domain-containing protein [Burkholderiales bacterium]